MTETDSYHFKNVDVTYRKADDVSVVTLGRSLYAEITNLESREEYFSFMDSIGGDESVNALLTINQEGSFDETAYGNLLTSIVGKEVDLARLDTLHEFKGSSARSRQLYFLHYLLLRRLDSNKLIIDGLQGAVVTPFFGECLSADFRFATLETRFSLCHVKYGLHPTAALVFFLPRFLGQGKSVELLLKGGEIDAEQALDLGLINGIFPKEEFESRCVEAAKELCNMGAATIGTRKLLYAPLKGDLEACFETETDLYLSSRW